LERGEAAERAARHGPEFGKATERLSSWSAMRRPAGQALHNRHAVQLRQLAPHGPEFGKATERLSTGSAVRQLAGQALQSRHAVRLRQLLP
jgi:hypothetical protein